jgi:CheY-like chemotaxis protein
MSSYLIVDSNVNYALKLYKALTDNDTNFIEKNIIVPSNHGFGTLSRIITERVNQFKELGEPDVRILINVEGISEGGCRQQQQLVEQAFWLRCKHNLTNPIIFYSLQSVNQLLKTKPENFILLAPGNYHIRQPLDPEIIKNSNFRSINKKDNLKPYLKPKINLEQTRHRYANYVGMILMGLLTEKVYPSSNILNEENELYGELFQFLNSLDYHLLQNYFNLSLDEIPPTQLASLKIQPPPENKILLIDDLSAGWKPIISQMIYGDSNDPNLDALTIQYKEKNNKKVVDIKVTQDALKNLIDSHKPHLILLDLRLNDEEGLKEVTDLGGFKLLRFIKTNPYYKGLPVIMFTASSNPDTVKTLIEAGAEYVWTKPGLDENLNTNRIFERYDRLSQYVTNIFYKFDKDIKLESGNNVEETRLKLFEKVEFTKYRAKLNNLRNENHYFNDFTDIFVDTNFAVEDARTLTNVFKLAQICRKSTHSFHIEGSNFQITAPKIVFDNFVIDEIIHHSKEVVEGKPYFWKISVIAYDLVRGLFQDDLARAEYNSFKISLEPESLLLRTEYNVHADPFIVGGIKNILSGLPFKLRRRFQNKTTKKWQEEFKLANYTTPQPRVLLLTNDGGLKSRVETEINSLASPNGTLEVIRSSNFNSNSGVCFNELIEAISL